MASNIIADLDHTIADAGWRDPMLGNWEEYYLSSIRDEPLRWTVGLLWNLHAFGYNIVCITGRPEKWRGLSMQWMMDHHIPVDEFYMRAETDHRPQCEVKLAMIHWRFPNLREIEFVLEDRADCCDMYRQAGINVLQVHKGRVLDEGERAPGKAAGDTPAEEQAVQG